MAEISRKVTDEMESGEGRWREEKGGGGREREFVRVSSLEGFETHPK